MNLTKLIRVSPQTHRRLKAAADARGMKLAAMADRMLARALGTGKPSRARRLSTPDGDRAIPEREGVDHG